MPISSTPFFYILKSAGNWNWKERIKGYCRKEKNKQKTEIGGENSTFEIGEIIIKFNFLIFFYSITTHNILCY